MPSGIIEFYTFWGKSVEDRIYESASHRRRIIRGWEQLYGSKFRQGYVHIIPDEEELLTNIDGTNTTRKGKRDEEIMNLKGKLSAANIAAKCNVPIKHVYAVHYKS